MDEVKEIGQESYSVGIIGMGPKGFYGLERLVAQINNMQLDCPVEIHVFNQNGFFGAGDIYRCDQPSYLIMNYANRNINIWTNELPQVVLQNTPDFTRWLSLKSGVSTCKIKDGFASRAMVGTYLMEGFTRLCQNLPEKIKVIPHISLVTDIKKGLGGYVLSIENNGIKFSKPLQKLLITTGHAWNGANFHKSSITKPFIDFIYPIDKKLGHINKNSCVAIKGMGLTSLDAIIGLTEGRGGLFKDNSVGGYVYIPSGNEPKKIIPFSRTGIPMIPRNGEADDRNPPYYLTEEALKESCFRSPISFEESILPLIQREFLFNYYRVLFKSKNRELIYHDEFTVIQKQIDDYHNSHPGDAKFDWENIENPFADIDHLSHETLLSYYSELSLQADLGLHLSPLLAAVGSWRKISAVFNRLYSYGRLDAQSHQKFDSYYFGLFNRIAYGPPIENVKKIIALAECGIIDFNFVKNPEVTFLKQSDSFRISCCEDSKSVSAEYLVDARIPKGCSNGKVSELFSNLINRGTVRYFKNKNSQTYAPGCVDIDYKGRPIDSDGKVGIDITFYGTPTEGITFDNDTLSRKRNNFASQWAFDVAMDIDRKNQNNKKNERKYGVL